MPIDTSMYNNIAMPDVGNALQAYAIGQQAKAQAGQNRLQQMQLRQAQRQQTDADTLNNAYRDNMNPDGSINYAGVQQSLAKNGSGTAIPGVYKQRQEAENAQLEHATKVLGLQKLVAGQVFANPSLANGLAALDQMEAVTGKGSMDAERQRLTAIGDNPDGIKAWAAGHVFDAKDMLAHYGVRDVGDRIENTATNPITGEVTVVSSVPKAMTPGEAASAQGSAASRAETARHNKITEDLMKNNPGVTYQTDGNGNIIALPTKAAPGGVVVGKPVTDAAGVPVQSGKGAQDKTLAYKAVDKLDATLAAYKKALEGAGRLDLANPMSSKNTEIASLATQLQMDYKTAAELGAIAGPDWAIINKIIQTPTSVGGIAKGPGVLLSQIDQVSKMSARDRALLDKRFGVKQPQTPPPPPLVNAKGWTLHTDKNGNRAYVSPDRKQYEEVSNGI